MKKKLPKKILPLEVTPLWLTSKRACQEDYLTFCAEWPDGADVTRKNLERAAQLGLDLEFFAIYVLPRKQFKEHQAQVKYLETEFLNEYNIIGDKCQEDCILLNGKSRKKLRVVISEYSKNYKNLCKKYDIEYSLAWVPILAAHYESLTCSI